MNTAAQILAIIKEEKFPFFCLQNAAGDSVIPWNSKKPHDAEHLKKIIFSLDKGKALANGIYYVVCANSTQSRAIKTKLEFHRGKVDAATSDVITPAKTFKEAPPQLPAGFSFSDLLKLNAELGELRAKVSFLESENVRLSKEIENLEDDLAAAEAEQKDGDGDGLGDGLGGSRAIPNIQQLIQLKILEMFSPAAGAAPAKEGGPLAEHSTPKGVTYEQVFNLLKNTPPDVVERLGQDLATHYEQTAANTPADNSNG